MLIKKTIVSGAAALGIAGLVLGTQAWSYIRTGVSNVQNAVQSEVPIAFEIDRARNEVQLLIPEIRRSLHVVAEEQVEVEHLKAALNAKGSALAEQQQSLVTLTSDLKSDRQHFVYAGNNYDRPELEKDLAERFSRFKIAEESLKKEREMLVMKERALTVHRDTLEKMLSQKKTMELELDRLQARLRTVESRKQISSLSIDDSKLAQVKSMIGTIDKKLDVEDAILDAEGNFSDLIPVTKPAINTVDIVAAVEAHLNPSSITPPAPPEVELASATPAVDK